MSPITMACAPVGWKAAQAVRPMGGDILTPPAIVTARSVRGTETLKTPVLSSSLPLAPVNCSMRAVSSGVAGAAADGTIGPGGSAFGELHAKDATDTERIQTRFRMRSP